MLHPSIFPFHSPIPTLLKSPHPMPHLFLLLLLLLIPTTSSTTHTCSPSHHGQHHPCPPFPSPPSTFPFSSLTSCNHPSFHITCSSSHSSLSINSITYLLLPSPSSHSLTLSPYIPTYPPSCPSLPSHPINLSSSPFHLPPLSPSCSLLSSHSCSPPPLYSSCNLSSFQSNLLQNPLLLLPSCRHPPHHPPSKQSTTTTTSTCISLIAEVLRNGITVEWDLSTDPYNASCEKCVRGMNGVCGFNDSDPGKPFLCFPSLDGLNKHSDSKFVSTRRRLLLVAAVFAGVCVFLVFVFIWVWPAVGKRWRYSRWRGGGGGGDPMAAVILHRHQQFSPPVYTYEQLRFSTNGFDPRRKIGDGGFGSVYLAQLEDGRIAAVKRLHRQHPAATTKAFCNEILILSSLRHPNLVRLHGYCYDPRGLLLVYDYVPNGTLADHLHGSRSLYRKGSLTWPVRVDVALQTASALEYLHFCLKPPVVHRDITSNNIFIERDMRVKVGDFGLSRLLSLPDPNSTVAIEAGSSSEYVCCTGPQGTPGYLDPEYHRSFRLTEKSDVYSFGVVLLELVTGMKAVDVRREKREVSLAELVVSKIQVGALHQVVDPVLLGSVEGMGTVEAVAELAFRCLAGEKDDRPNAREIVEELKRIRGKIDDGGSQRL